MFHLMEAGLVSDLHFKYDPLCQLRAIIAIHSTRMGPALGGCRFIEYDDTESAVTDAIRLARGMSYKAVMAGLEQGGGKSVIIKPRGEFDRAALFKAFGQFVNELGGRYITAIDAGTNAADMDIIETQTAYVTSTSHEDNPSMYTAHGVFGGIKAAVTSRLGRNSLQGIRVAIQGLGNVGMPLAKHLHEAGARLVVSDIDAQRTAQAAQNFDAEVVDPDAIYSATCEVFAPCGLGAILNESSIAQLKCQIVAGSANNQLAEATDGERLFARDILYAPDYVINGGGLIYAALHHRKKPLSQIQQKTEHIAQTLSEIFTRATDEGCATSAIADRMAESRLYGI